jgi:PAS domain S-box-containing protein
LFAHSPSAIVLFRTNGTIEDLNPAMCRMLGYDRKDLEGRNWWNLLETHSMEAALAGIQRLVERRPESVEFEARMRGRSGERIWCHVGVALVPGDGEDQDGPLVQAHLVDITSSAEMQRELLQRLTRLDRQLQEEHVRAALALRESEERFRGVFEQAPIGMAIAGLDGRFQQVNSALCRMLGIDPGQAAGASWDDFLDPSADDSANLSRRAQRSPNPSAILECDTRFRARDGRCIDVQWSLSLARDARGEPSCQVGQVCDISPRKRAEAALTRYAADLDRSNRDLQDFASVASHDLQEPLRMVKSYLELLSRRYKGKLDSDADEFIGYALEGAGRMQNFVAGLLAYSRVGAPLRDCREVDTRASLEAALANLHMAVRETGATVTHSGLPRIEADGLQVTQLLQNLVANSIKFRSQEPPRIHIEAKPRRGHWEFRVSDNGIGIDPRYSDRVFQVFQRLHSQSRYPGAGIGLAVCKRIVERHGGTIHLEEPAADGGATFVFTLPDRVRTSPSVE